MNIQLRPGLVRCITSLMVGMACSSMWGPVVKGDDKVEKSIADQLPRIAPLSPAEAGKSFQLKNGFYLQLLAAEPLVTDPIAMQYDENGRAYVIEMNDYPYTDPSLDVAWKEQQSPAQGRVRLLEDNDGDGTFDKSTVFAEQLSWPTGIACWKGGVFVTATPDIWYLKDTDGDGKADVRRKVFTGFRKFNVQAVINNLQWGLDHWLYAAGSSNGGSIRPGDNPKAAVKLLRRNDFRIHPVSDDFEVLAGGARFGNTFDDWGNRFICNIRNPVQHIVVPNRYLSRNKELAVQSGLFDVAIAGDAVPVYRISPAEPWRVMNARRLSSNRMSRSPNSEKVATGFVTSCAGLTVYRGAAYPDEYYGDIFIGEVAGNLAMRYKLTQQGATFTAQRSDDKQDFLASRDNWFRPVNFVNAPDGTLHILDMYRETIEHPWSIPDDIKKHVDLQSGRDRGRIYRLMPPKFNEKFVSPRQPRLGSANIAELVATLEDPNSWWRETAHRLIFERQDQAAIEPLRELLAESSAELARLHAMWSLHGLNALTDDNLATALADTSPGVRIHAIRLTESRLTKNKDLAKQVEQLANDSDPRVRFQVALSLGEITNDQVSQPLLKIAQQDAADDWSRIAVLSSMGTKIDEYLVTALAAPTAWNSEAGEQLLHDLAVVVGRRKSKSTIRRVVEALTLIQSRFDKESPDAQLVATPLVYSVAAGLGEGLLQVGVALEQLTEEKVGSRSKLMSRLFQGSISLALDANVSVTQRQAAIRFLAYNRFENSYPVLADLITPTKPQNVQTAAVDTLSRFNYPDVAEILLNRYSQLTPAVRVEVVDALLSSSDRTGPLLDAIQSGQISVGEVPPIRRGLLMKSRDKKIQKQAVALFSEDQTTPRSTIVKKYQDALELDANLMRGKKVFARECTTCHKLGNEGHMVGPNLATIKNRSSTELLTHILDPNREVSPNYLEYVVVMESGQVKTGLIADETATSITLRRAENKQETLLRSQIDTITSSGKSLMPEGVEKKVNVQEMADLIQYLLAPVEPN